MKKYNLSKIMKRAWKLVKRFGLVISESLKKAWKEAKGMKIEMCVVGKETFTVDTVTGIVTGKTYHAKDFLKDNFSAKWDGISWTVDIDKFNSEMEKYADYYKKYIVSTCPKASANMAVAKTIASEKLINCNDGFYNLVTYTDGSTDKIFVG